MNTVVQSFSQQDLLELFNTTATTVSLITRLALSEPSTRDQRMAAANAVAADVILCSVLLPSLEDRDAGISITRSFLKCIRQLAVPVAADAKAAGTAFHERCERIRSGNHLGVIMDHTEKGIFRDCGLHVIQPAQKNLTDARTRLLAAMVAAEIQTADMA